jgi:molybdate/tungstate transport system ATP-binding protein
LAMRPRVLVFDEPLSALDDDTRAEMYDLIDAVRRQTPVTVLHITHNRAEAEHLADRLFELRAGAVLDTTCSLRRARILGKSSGGD